MQSNPPTGPSIPSKQTRPTSLSAVQCSMMLTYPPFMQRPAACSFPTATQQFILSPHIGVTVQAPQPSTIVSPKQRKTEEKCSFSIASILSDKKSPSSSPVTPLSSKPVNQFFYLYPPPSQLQPTGHYPFQSLDNDLLHRGLHGRLTAPVAVISEIVRNAGELLTQFHSCIQIIISYSG